MEALNATQKLLNRATSNGNNNCNENSMKISKNDEELIYKYIAMSCDLCVFRADNFKGIQEHFKHTHGGIKPFIKCCGRKLYHRCFLVEHARLHENPDYLKCHECGKVYSSSRILRDHCLTHVTAAHLNLNQKVEHFPCSSCDKHFITKFKLAQHMYNSHPSVTYTCEHCNKVFKAKRTYIDHMSRHINEPIFECQFCTSLFKTYTSLYQHIRRSHPLDWDDWRKKKNSKTALKEQTEKVITLYGHRY